MDADGGRYSIEELLADAGWTRGLAVALVKDSAAAEDVVQETFAAALAHPPRDDRPARLWLATVARNFARKRRREESRRHAREAVVARPEAGAVPSPEELAIRLETQRGLARHVAELDEPYRATVILRFWEGLSSAEIARRTGVPAGTVRWRLKSALDTLRDRLDARHGDRRAWALLLLPLIDRPRAAVTAGMAGAAAAGIPGGALVVKKLALAAALAVLAAAGLWLGGAIESLASAPDPAPRAGPHADPDSAGAGAVAAAPGTEDAAGSTPAAGVAPDPEEGRVVARIVDPDGHPIAGAELRYGTASDAYVARSDADGAVTLALPVSGEASGLSLLAFAPGRERVEMEVVARKDQLTELGRIVLRPGGAVTGRVYEPDGTPSGLTRVVLEAPRGPLDLFVSTRITGPTDRSRSGYTAADGTFRIDGLPEGSYRAWAGRRGMRWAVSGILTVRAGAPVGPVELRIEPLAPGDRVAGVVLDPDGAPVARARVRYRLHHESDTSDGWVTANGEGRFELLTPGVLSIDFTARDSSGRFGETVREGVVPGEGEVVLRLGSENPGRILVSDGEGDPLAEFSFHFLDPDSNAVIGHADGRDGRADVTFPARAFKLMVMARGYGSKTVGPFDGPEEIVVILARIAGIAGRVVADGEPVAGARVLVQLVARPGHNVIVNGFRAILISGAGETVTEKDGTFHVGASLGGTMLVRVEAEGFAPTESERFEYAPDRGVEGVVVHPVRGGAIAGRVVALGGTAAGAIVAINRGDSFARTVRADAEGRFRFENLTPGPWSVTLTDEEIDPDMESSSSGFGTPTPIPFNCEVRSGETAEVELTLDRREAAVSGRLLIDGRAPTGWTAGLYEEDGGLAPLVKADVAEDGTFRLARAAGRYRMIVAEPGATHEARLVVAQVDLVGTVPFELDLATAELDAPAPAEDEVLYHRFATAGGVLVLTPIPAGGGAVRVPAGEGEIVRFDLASWNHPRKWPVVRAVEVR